MVEDKKRKRGLNLESSIPEEREAAIRKLTNLIAYSNMHKINVSSTIPPSTLVVTVLLTHPGRGIGKKELIQKVVWLRKQIETRSGDISSFARGDPELIINKVTFLLRNLITRDVRLLETVYKPNKRFELSYYRNTTMHLFVPESTIACAMYPYINKSITPATQSGAIIFNGRRGVIKTVLHDDVQYLSRMLKWEFIYKPAQNFHKNFDETFELMRSRGIIELDTKENIVTIPPEGDSTHQFLCFLLWPFIEAYWMVCTSLWGLYPNYLTEEKSYYTKVTKYGETLYHQGELSFFESISMDMTKMALQRCVEDQIVERKQINDKLVAIKLKEEYQNLDKLTQMVERIGKYRRHGKYSQEGNFSQRIRDLASLITPQKAKL